MQIDILCKQLALQDLFEEYAMEPGSGFQQHELQRLWQRTGLRNSDLDAAITHGISAGLIAARETSEGFMTVLTEAGHRQARQSPETLRQIEAHARALTTLEWARGRRRRGYQGSRRQSDALRLVR